MSKDVEVRKSWKPQIILNSKSATADEPGKAELTLIVMALKYSNNSG